MAKIDTFFDDFNDNSLDAKWTDESAGQGAETNKQIELTSKTTLGYFDFRSTDSYDLTSSDIFCKFVDVGNQSITTFEAIMFVTTSLLDSNNKLYLSVNQNVIHCRKIVDGVNTEVGYTDYDPDVHKYFRFRESGGTFYYDYSTDSVTWTNLFSVANPFTLTAVWFAVQVGTWSNEASVSTAKFDNVNIDLRQFKTLTSDGIVIERKTKTLTSDGVVKVITSKEITADGVVKVTTTKEVTADGIVKEIKTATVTSDGIVKAFSLKTITIDGIVIVGQTKTFTTDGYIKEIHTKTFTADGLIGRFDFRLNEMFLPKPDYFRREFIPNKAFAESINGRTGVDVVGGKEKFVLGYRNLTRQEADLIINIVGLNTPVLFAVDSNLLKLSNTYVLPEIYTHEYQKGGDYLSKLSIILTEAV